MDSVVVKRINPSFPDKKAVLHQGRHNSKYFVHRLLRNHRQRSDIEAVAHTGTDFDKRKGFLGQLPDFLGHEIDYIVRHLHFQNGLQVPLPPSGRIGCQVLSFIQGFEKLGDKERVAKRFTMNHRCQGLTIGRSAPEKSGQKPIDIRFPKRGEMKAFDIRSRLAGGVNGQHEGMVCRDLIVPVGADQEEIMQVTVKSHVLKQVDAGGVGPLQVIQKQY